MRWKQLQRMVGNFAELAVPIPMGYDEKASRREAGKTEIEYLCGDKQTEVRYSPIIVPPTGGRVKEKWITPLPQLVCQSQSTMSVCRRSPEGCTKHFYFSVATRQARQEPRTINMTQVWLASVRYIMPLGWDGEAQKSRAHVLHEECLRQFLPSFQGQPRLKSSFTDLLPLPGQDLLGERCFRNSSDCTFYVEQAVAHRVMKTTLAQLHKPKKSYQSRQGRWKVNERWPTVLHFLCYAKFDWMPSSFSRNVRWHQENPGLLIGNNYHYVSQFRGNYA